MVSSVVPPFVQSVPSEASLWEFPGIAGRLIV